MYQSERLEQILEILKKYQYVTVKYLTEELHYSTATINRDLNILEAQKLIKRSYGAAELSDVNSVPLQFRYHKMKIAKNRIGKAAASFVEDGDVIFVDGSTTAQSMAQYLTEKKGITVITNNMALVSFLGEYGINAICLGGGVSEAPNMLGTDLTSENASQFIADKCFFATVGMTDSGEICDGETYYLLHRIMMKNSGKVFYLVDHDKLSHRTGKPTRIISHEKNVDYVISDFDFSDEVKRKNPLTSFIMA